MAKSCESSVQDKIAEVTECSICVQIFTDPKSLPCIHTFCLPCLEEYGKDRTPGDQLVCPICRNEFFIPDGGMCNLPNNFFIGKMVEIGKLANLPANEAMCDLCPEGEELVAKMYCIDCEQILCERCSKSHKKTKLCQNHQVVELGSKLNAPNFNLGNSYCNHHPKELTKMYCYDDKVVICLICCVESHQSHRCVNIEKAAGDFTKQLKEDQRKVTDRLSECENVREKLDKYKNEFTEEILKTEESIRDIGTKLKMLIEEYTEILVENLISVRDQNLKAFEITKQDVERFIVMIDSFSKYSEELLSRGSPVDICRDADQMHTRANELEKFPSNCRGEYFCCDTVVFQPSSFENILMQCMCSNTVGELTVTESPNRIIKFETESTVSVPCESVGVVKRFVPMDLGVTDVLIKCMKDELQKIDADLKECSGSMDTSKDESGFILTGNEHGVGKAVKDLQTLIDCIVMCDHDIDRPGIPAYFYSKHGREVLRGIQVNHKVSIQLDKTSRAYPEAEITPVKFMIPMQGDTIKVDDVSNEANVDLRIYGGITDAIARPEYYAGAMQRTRTVADPRQQGEEQLTERHPQNLSRIILSIYALSQQAIDDVLKDIEEVIEEYIIDIILDSPQDQQSIAKLSPGQVNRIKDMANFSLVQIEVETVYLMRIRIHGPRMEAMSVIGQVHKIFQEAHKNEIKKMEDEWIATVTDWEYDDGSVFSKYPKEINAIIERSYYRLEEQYAEWEEENEKYRLTFETMLVECMTNWVTPSVKVRRVAKEMDVPANWETMKIDEYFKTVQLKASDQEYKDVEKTILSTAQTTVNQIMKIERIQNKMLYKQYVLRKAAMDTANPGVQNEMTLWRGTSADPLQSTGADILESISRSGFNRHNCRKLGFLYGKGVNFVKHFSQSAQNTYSPKDANGYKHVYQCKVLTGEYAVGNQSMIVPPSKPGSSTMKYDCTVDNAIDPKIFVIYFYTQVYPEYLICFK